MIDWTASAWPVMASVALKSMLVLSAAWLMAYLLRGRSAAARHIVWTMAAAATVALPLLSVGLPALRVRLANAVLPADAGLVFRATAAAPAATGGAAAARPSTGHGGEAQPVAGPGINGKGALVLLWMAGIVAGFAQMLAAGGLLWRMRRRAGASPDQGAADTLACSLGIGGTVRVLETASGMPMTFGVLRPTVLLPREARAWSGERRDVVLLHELSHVMRGDVATHLLARVALALHWWNPLAWTMWREFLKERERATDDMVLGAGATATEYAGHLLEIARTMQALPAGAVAGVAMARRSQLEGRLLAILDSHTRRGRQGRAATLAAVVAAIVIMAPVAAVRAQSPAEQNAPDVAATIRTANAQKNHEILDQAAVTYEQLRKFVEAQTLREASLALAEQLAGRQSADYAIALVKLGDLARQRGARQESKDYYLKALALGDRPEVFSALVHLGRDAFRGTARGAERILAILDGDRAKAFDYLRRARNVANNGNDLCTALTWIAQLRQNESDGAEEAESLYRAAMAAADAESAEQAIALEFYTEFLKKQDRRAETEQMEARAKAIRKARVHAMEPRAASATMYKAGGDVKSPLLLYKVEPQYSDEARAAKLAGTALLNVVIDVDGRAKEFELMNSLGLGLDEQAVLAIRQWKFKPGEKGGVPVQVQAMIEVNFRLQ
jgi:TonB family protein